MGKMTTGQTLEFPLCPGRHTISLQVGASPEAKSEFLEVVLHSGDEWSIDIIGLSKVWIKYLLYGNYFAMERPHEPWIRIRSSIRKMG